MKSTYIVIAVAILIFVGIVFYINKSGGGNNVVFESASAQPSASPTTMNQDNTASISEAQNKFEERLNDLMKREKVLVRITTPKGDIDVALYPKVAPKTVENFLGLSLAGFYDGLKFHRVVEGFVAQGGDPLSRTDDPRVGSGGPGYAFEDEINPKSLGLADNIIKAYESKGYKYSTTLKSLPMKVGALAMANSGPNTNGSQFFIVTEEDQPHLNGLHTVFGEVMTGMDIVLKIQEGDTMKIGVEQ